MPSSFKISRGLKNKLPVGINDGNIYYTTDESKFYIDYGNARKELNAKKADSLLNARKITLTGDVSGEVTFDGSQDVSITTTIVDDSHNHIISNIDNLQTTLDDKVSKSATGVQCIAGGLVVGRTSSSGLSGTGVGRIMFTGQANPLIGLQAINSAGNVMTPYYLQALASDDSLYIGPTSSKALKMDGNGNMTSPANLTIGGIISEGGKVLSEKYASIELVNTKYDKTGGNISGHIYLTGADAGSSTSNTSQIIFGTANDNHVAITSNRNAIVINPNSASTAGQIVLYLNQASSFPKGINGNASSATKLQTARTITLSGAVSGSGSFDGSDNLTITTTSTASSNAAAGSGYGTCSTAASTAAKVATLSNYALTTGGTVAIKFTNAVPANATLNINSKGAKSIYYKGKAIVNGIINAGEVAFFIFDGTYYHLLGVDRDRFFTTLVPYGTQITASSTSTVTLNNPTYMKVGNYFCSANAQAEFITDLPKTKTAFMMSVYSPLSQTVDNETGTWVYRIRKIQFYTGEEFIQYSYTNGTAGNWVYGAWKCLVTATQQLSFSVTSDGILQVTY